MANCTRFQLRGDTKANWLSVNPILAKREPAIETDTNRFKIGDGVSTYSQLSYGRNTSEYASLYNVTSLFPLPSGFYKHATAILAIPTSERLKGLIITYETASGVWYTERFIGTNVSGWTTLSNWEKVTDASDVAQLRSDLNELNNRRDTIEYDTIIENYSPSYVGVARNINLFQGDVLSVSVAYNGSDYSIIEVQAQDNLDNWVDLSSIYSTEPHISISIVEEYKNIRFYYSINGGSGTTTISVKITPFTIVKLNQTASDFSALEGGVYKSLSSKIETNSINIIDYDKCSLNKGLGVFGEVVDNTPYYTISDYIPVKQGDEIIADVWNTSSTSWSPYAVYDINLNYIRSIRNDSEPSHYVYQEGDAYIRCMFIGIAIQYMYGNYGSTLLPYQKYNPIKAYFDMENQKDRDDITGLQNEVDVVGNSVESIVQLHPYNYVINQDGDIVVQNLEICPILKVRVTPFTKYKLDDVRPIVVATGTYYKYAWYSSYEIIGSTTFISGELGTAPFDEHIIKTITPPAGAMALVVMAYYGTENIKKEQNSANSMLELYFKRNIMETFFNFSFKQVINGNQKIYGTAYSLNNFGVNPTVDGVSLYENTLSLSGRGWCYFGPFNPDNDEIIHISFNVSRLVKAEGADISIWVSKAVGSAGADQRSLGVIDHIGDYHIYLDPTYYRIYHGYSDTFYVWIYKHDYAIETCVIENFRVYAMVDSEEFNNIEGITSEELFKSTDEGIGLLNKAVDKKKYLVAPNGNKYDYGVDNNGNIIAIPVIPNKAAFFGNSLMFGNVYFGMDASDENSDFYARVNAYIKTLNPNFTANRYSSVSFETIDSLANIDSVVNSTVNNLNGDEDLIIIQAGDNTTDAQSTSIMPTSCMKLLAAIKNRCPNARICWPAIWYATIDKMNNVRNACDRYGAVIATIGELNIPENRGTIGSVIDYGEGHSVESTLNDVISVVENSSTNITITFTYGGNTYTQTIDVNSYTLNGTTLVFTGRYGICTVGAGHPGNRGMKAIANKILYSMGICDDENAYPLD